MLFHCSVVHKKVKELQEKGKEKNIMRSNKYKAYFHLEYCLCAWSIYLRNSIILKYLLL